MKIVDKSISSYVFTDMKPYLQYQDSLLIRSFFTSLNKYVEELLNKELNAFKEGLNLRGDGSQSSYTEFYLLNFIGLSPIPNPSNSAAQTRNLYDNLAKFDGSQPIIYDDLVVDDSSLTINLTPPLFIAVAKFILDYSLGPFSIPNIYALLKLWYEASEHREFNPTSIKLTDVEGVVTLICPRGVKAWENLRLIVRYSPDLVGLPYGDSVNLVIEEAPNEAKNEVV